ncbi:hypothetical protein EVAR_74833_1 [Eumeta japonica]|uniref:Uncharacterized protein n=1 Tax=Eumeta variegata TaxID=151549 RepID=A0A4C1SQ29_EUMVA|nr:hypothetical protein EVAR_74833_1 [Eumeta japonica]
MSSDFVFALVTTVTEVINRLQTDCVNIAGQALQSRIKDYGWTIDVPQGRDVDLGLQLPKIIGQVMKERPDYRTTGCHAVLPRELGRVNTAGGISVVP